MPAVARNLAIIEEMGLNVLTLCNGCYTFISEFAHFMNEKPPVKNFVNNILPKIGRKYKGSQDIYHVFELFYRIKERIKEKVKRPLKGLRFATHYGCHYLNGFKTTAIDDAFMPTGLEEIIDILGGESIEYSENRSCCGTGLTQVILHKEELSLPHTKIKLDNLKESGPDAVVVMCPYCLSQLDRMQQKFNSRTIGTYQLPIIHITQLVGLALGLDSTILGLDGHAISFKSFLTKFVHQTSEVASVFNRRICLPLRN
jgi:heterodisulfide reductase subunit B